jgi:ADP-ribosyl-[dinitrogen reductase] hydrolase
VPDADLAEAQARDRALGALLGLAIGDAIGTTLEFAARDTAEVTDMVGGGPFQLPAGYWTDDTSMALCLAQSLLASRGFDAEDFARRLSRWYRDGENSPSGTCIGIGTTTRTALDRFLADGRTGGAPAGERDAGNGSLVRAAPVAIFCRRDAAMAQAMAAAQSRVTHGAEEAVTATRLFTATLWKALNGAGRTELFPSGDPYRTKRRDEIRSSGYVVETMEAALWAVFTTRSFRQAVLVAANLGDDADSVAAAAGQLAGALYGTTAIPAAWIQRLAWRNRIADMAEKLFESAVFP